MKFKKGEKVWINKDESTGTIQKIDSSGDTDFPYLIGHIWHTEKSLTKYGEPIMNNKEIKIYLDGDKWCAVRSDFIDLKESLAGFGDTPSEACRELEIAEENE